MLITKSLKRFDMHRPLHVALALLIIVASLIPLLSSRLASAATLQLGSRYLELSTAVPGASGASNQYKFSFVLATLSGTSDVEGIKFEACTAAIGTCNTPTGLNFASAAFVSQNGNWEGATNFAVVAGANDCTTGTRVICASRTNTTNQTTSTAREITFNTITSPSTPNSTFFVRIKTYDNNTFVATDSGANTNELDSGTVAAAITQTLTVSAYVAEVLNFCVGATGVDDATTSVGASCTNVTGTTVNIGVLEDGVTNVSPVDASPYNGNDLNGVAMIRSNAINGATVSYKSIQAAGTNQLGTLRLSGVTCSATVTDATDGCIQAQGTTQAALDAGTSSGDRFGMTIAAINCGSTTSYTCVFATPAYNLVRDTAYDGTGANTYPTDTTSQVSGATNAGYAWDDSGASDQIASSTSSSSKVIDDEAMILKFAAYSAITTPFGTYTAQGDFIALATY